MTDKRPARARPTEMTGRDAAEIVGMVERLGVRIWVDGGWAADALLGRQTRYHHDLDVVVEQKDLDAVVKMFQTRGYRPAQGNNRRPWNFALGDGARREVDFHVIVLDEEGNGICGRAADGKPYSADALKGIGAIHGKVVRCISQSVR